MSASIATSAKPVPVPDESSAPFFDGALADTLMLRRCRACNTFMSPIAGVGAPVRSRCVACFSGDVEWAPSSGLLKTYSFVIMHQLYDDAFAADIPYNLGVIETAEGGRLTSQVTGCPKKWLRMEMALE